MTRCPSLLCAVVALHLRAADRHLHAAEAAMLRFRRRMGQGAVTQGIRPAAPTLRN